MSTKEQVKSIKPLFEYLLGVRREVREFVPLEIAGEVPGLGTLVDEDGQHGHPAGGYVLGRVYLGLVAQDLCEDAFVPVGLVFKEHEGSWPVRRSF